MKLYIAGGCGEYGRNCFLIEGEKYRILLDCGNGRSTGARYPVLSKEQIRKVQYCFLTHSHKDHAGALEWLKEQGFCGKIYMTEETKNQLSRQYGRIDSFCMLPENHQVNPELKVFYGKNGHGPGSVWYLLEFEKKRLFFSGDYNENSCLYACDPVENLFADLAVVDCAYGNTLFSAESKKEELKKHLCHNIEMKKNTLLPVPSYGRGAELLNILAGMDKGISVYCDKGMQRQSEDIKHNTKWISDEKIIKKKLIFRNLEDWRREPAMLFLSDPQLEKSDSKALAKKILESGGEIILTGHVYNHTFAEILLDQNKAEMFLFPIHMNRNQAEEFCKKNNFRKIILNHSSHSIIPFPNTVNLKPGDYIEV